jgi:hypothetical protein
MMFNEYSMDILAILGFNEDEDYYLYKLKKLTRKFL